MTADRPINFKDLLALRDRVDSLAFCALRVMSGIQKVDGAIEAIIDQFMFEQECEAEDGTTKVCDSEDISESEANLGTEGDEQLYIAERNESNLQPPG